MSGITSTTARPSAHARLDALDERFERLERLVEGVATSVSALVSATGATRPVVTQTAEPVAAPVAAARTGRPRDAAGRFLPEGGKPATRTARTRTAPAAPKAEVTRKGEQAVGKGALTGKEWNRTLSAKARLAGKRGGVSVYAHVNANWALVQEQRKAGMTPDQVLSAFL